jgi:hypothetical protein
VLPGRTRLIPGESLAYSLPPRRKVVARETLLRPHFLLSIPFSSLHLACPAPAPAARCSGPAPLAVSRLLPLPASAARSLSPPARFVPAARVCSGRVPAPAARNALQLGGDVV